MCVYVHLPGAGGIRNDCYFNDTMCTRIIICRNPADDLFVMNRIRSTVVKYIMSSERIAIYSKMKTALSTGC